MNGLYIFVCGSQHFNIQLTHTTLKNVELLKHFKISKKNQFCVTGYPEDIHCIPQTLQPNSGTVHLTLPDIIPSRSCSVYYLLF